MYKGEKKEQKAVGTCILVANIKGLTLSAVLKLATNFNFKAKQICKQHRFKWQKFISKKVKKRIHQPKLNEYIDKLILNPRIWWIKKGK